MQFATAPFRHLHDGAVERGPLSETFDYDALARLRHWTSTSGQYGLEYRYDDLGNLTFRQLTRAGAPAAADTFVFGERSRGPHQLTSAPWGAYDYDQSGD
jgi:hypothetical protein